MFLINKNNSTNKKKLKYITPYNLLEFNKIIKKFDNNTMLKIFNKKKMINSSEFIKLYKINKINEKKIFFQIKFNSDLAFINKEDSEKTDEELDINSHEFNNEFYEEDLEDNFNIKMYDRSSIITPKYINKKILLYNGKKFIKILINSTRIGYKFGQFTYTKQFDKSIHVLNKVHMKEMKKKRIGKTKKKPKIKTKKLVGQKNKIKKKK